MPILYFPKMKRRSSVIWKDHSRDVRRGDHAFMGGSNSSWLRYDREKLITSYFNAQAKIEGTEKHDFAAKDIEFGKKYGFKRPRTKNTYYMYVNDAIGFRMETEKLLYYSEYAYGWADTIVAEDEKHILRIHDLKTGITQAHMEQLIIYAALWCLDYEQKPGDWDIKLRIYQNNEINGYDPPATDILPIMDQIITNTKILRKASTGEEVLL